MQFSVGENIRVRGARWAVDEVTRLSDCTLLCLSALDASVEPRRCRLLLPYDRPTRWRRRPRAHVVAPQTWLRQLQGALADARGFGELRAAPAAGIDVLPFQLEPALALISGRASRFLLADEVGLGKTIQAGLMLAELQQRGWCEHAIVLTPAGLRRQWADELERRFQIRAAVIDASALAAMAAAMPLDVNPWSVEPVVIASIDFVKQPEVLRSLQQQLWDVLIVDEAHQASTASLRYDAVQSLAIRSRHVVLLTATPHAGDDAAYRALCDLGRLDPLDPILLFRRTRRQVRRPQARRVHLLPVRLTPQGRTMHQVLAEYVRRLWDTGGRHGRRDIQLVATVLSKRAHSSASSLAASIERRRAALTGSATHSQPALPFDVDFDSTDEPPETAGPAFENGAEEAEMLRRVLEAARAATDDERKVQAVRRLIRRVREPVIVFTEYRDTLDVLEAALRDLATIATLHGGKTADERGRAVREFTSGAASVLLATDAGAEGLNLHTRCRLVVNLELPWNPIRLEQRIGRVDRIGQKRTVHAINLFAKETPESVVLAALVRRLDRIQASEIEIAASVIGRAELPAATHDGTHTSHEDTADLRTDAAAEAARIQTARVRAATSCRTEEGWIPATLLGRAASPVLKRLDRHLVWFVRVRIATASGRLMDDAIMAIVTVPPAPLMRTRPRIVMARAVAEGGGRIIEFVTRLAHERARSLERGCAGWLSRALDRERRLQRMSSAEPTSLIQPGLFDNRTLRMHGVTARARATMTGASAARRDLLEAALVATIASEPELALLLMVRLKRRPRC